MRINTNVAALNTQRILASSTEQTSQLIGRLATGLRIVNASDDAAGLGISNKLGNDIRSLQQAARNADQATAMVQIAEGATGAIQGILDRMKELAAQAASSNSGDRRALDSEFGALQGEIARIVSTTTYRGANLIDGSFGAAGPGLAGADLHVSNGAAAGAYTLSVSGNDVTLSLGATQQTIDLTSPGGLVSYAGGKATLDFDTMDIAIDVTASSGSDAIAMQAALDGRGFSVTSTSSTSASGGVIDGYDEVPGFPGFDRIWLDSPLSTGPGADGTYSFSYSKASQQTTLLKGGTPVAISNAIDLLWLTTGAGSQALDFKKLSDGSDFGLVVGVLNYSAGLSFASEDAFKAAIEDPSAGFTISTTTTSSYDSGTGVSGNAPGAASFLVSSSGAYGSDDLVGLDPIDLQLATLGIDGSDLVTQGHAQDALAALDGAVDTVNTALGSMGAFQDRIGYAGRNTAVTLQNYQAAQSSIRDADMAETTSEFTRLQVLQQAGTAMLAQANSSAQLVLKLLG